MIGTSTALMAGLVLFTSGPPVTAFTSASAAPAWDRERPVRALLYQTTCHGLPRTCAGSLGVSRCHPVRAHSSSRTCVLPLGALWYGLSRTFWGESAL